MEHSFGLLSLVPTLIAIILALTTKQVVVSLLVGVFSGVLIYSDFALLQTVETSFELITSKMADNASMIVFLALLGSLVAVITLAGGSEAYGKWASERISTKKGASLATVGLGILIFIDDYFNCLTVGTVMRPVTDKNGISRAKLAYLIDATAAPIVILAPVSSWAASIVVTIAETGRVDDPFGVFIQSIPYNFYAILTIIAVFYFCISDKDIGPMANPELLETSVADDSDVVLSTSKGGTVYDLVIPVVTLVITTVLAMMYTGGFFDGVSLGDAFGDSDVNMSLIYGAFVSIVLAFCMFIPRKLATVSEFMEAFTTGVKSMVPAILILILAWSIGGVCGSDFLATGDYIGSFINDTTSIIFLPAIIFVVAGFLGFSTGTAWGTFGILIPILVPIVLQIATPAELPIVLGAIFSGSVIGDHCSPISDTTILSSTGAGCDHITHVSTQIPYVLVVAIPTVVSFIVSAIFGNPWGGLVVGIVTLFAILQIVTRRELRK